MFLNPISIDIGIACFRRNLIELFRCIDSIGSQKPIDYIVASLCHFIERIATINIARGTVENSHEESGGNRIVAHSQYSRHFGKIF